MVKRKIYGVDARSILLELRKLIACLPVPSWIADDICQQAVLKLAEREAEGTTVDDPIEYVKQCARNFAVDWLRRRASHERTKQAFGVIQDLTAGPPRPDDQVMTKDLLAKLKAMTDDGSMRNWGAMLYLSGWTMAELKSELGLSRATVRWGLRGINEKLKGVKERLTRQRGDNP